MPLQMAGWDQASRGWWQDVAVAATVSALSLAMIWHSGASAWMFGMVVWASAVLGVLVTLKFVRGRQTARWPAGRTGHAAWLRGIAHAAKPAPGAPDTSALLGGGMVKPNLHFAKPSLTHGLNGQHPRSGSVAPVHSPNAPDGFMSSISCSSLFTTHASHEGCCSGELSGAGGVPVGALTNHHANALGHALGHAQSSSPLKSWHHLCAPLAPYKSRLSCTSVHLKIPFIEPEDLPPDFLVQLQAQLREYTHGCLMINNAAVRRGCVELVLDIVQLSRAASQAQGFGEAVRPAAPQGPVGAGVPAAPDPEQRDARSYSSENDPSASAPVLLDQREKDVGTVRDGAASTQQSRAGPEAPGAHAPSGSAKELSPDPAGSAAAAETSLATALRTSFQALLSGDSNQGEQLWDAAPQSHAAEDPTPPHDVETHPSLLAALSPLDWVHWLYLQPPADAEVLVQACGRAFVTAWDAPHQHWLTKELDPAAYNLMGGSDDQPVPLPKVDWLEPACLLLQDAQPGAEVVGEAGPRPCVHRLLLCGSHLHNPGASFATRFHGSYLHVEWRVVPAPSGAAHSAALTGGTGTPTSTPAPATTPSGDTDDSGSAAPVPGSGQWVELSVHGITRPGLLQLEGWCGRLLTCRRQLAVVQDVDVQQELSHVFSVRAVGAAQSAPGSAICATPPSVLPSGALSACSTPRVDLRHLSAGSLGGGVGGAQHEGGAGAGSSPPLPPSIASTVMLDRKLDDMMTDLGCWLEFCMAVRADTRTPRQSGGHGSAASGFGSPVASRGDAAPDAWVWDSATGSQGWGVSSASAGAGRDCREGGATPQVVLRTSSVNLPAPLLLACSSPDYRDQMLDTASQLLAHSCSCGWVATARLLFDSLLSLGMSYSEVKQRTCSGGMTLLHRAVCSGKVTMVQLVVGWGEAHRQPWAWSESDPVTGVTPLHMAAMMMPGVPGLPTGVVPSGWPSADVRAGPGAAGNTLVQWILQEHEAACRYWLDATDSRGVTPADVAHARHAGAAMDVPLGPAGARLLAAGESSAGPPTGEQLEPFPPTPVLDSLSETGAWLPNSPVLATLATADTVVVEAADGSATGGEVPAPGPEHSGRSQTHESAPDLGLGIAHGGPTAPATYWPAGDTSAPGAAGMRLVPRAEFEPAPALPRSAQDVGEGSDSAVPPPPAPAPPGMQPDFHALLASIQQGMYRSDPTTRHAVLVEQALAAAAGVARNDLVLGRAAGVPGRGKEGEMTGAAMRGLSIHSWAADEYSPSVVPSITPAPTPDTSGRGEAGAGPARAGAPRPPVPSLPRPPAPGGLRRRLPASSTAAPAVAPGLPAGPGRTSVSPRGSGVVAALAATTDASKVARALAAPALLRACFTQFASARLEHGFRLWMRTHRTPLRLAVPQCMLAISCAAFAVELLGPCEPLGLLTYTLYALPWALLLLPWDRLLALLQPHGQAGRAARGRSGRDAGRVGHASLDEEVWTVVMLWHVVLRFLQATGVLMVPPSAVRFLCCGGDCISEGIIPLLFQVRTQPMACIRLLFTVSSAALYVRLGHSSLWHALGLAVSWNLGVLVIAWVLDLNNRRTFLRQLMAALPAAGQDGDAGPGAPQRAALTRTSRGSGGTSGVPAHVSASRVATVA